MLARIAVLAFAVTLVASTAIAAPPNASALRLVPFPKQVNLAAGSFDLARAGTLETPVALAATVRQLVTAELRRAKCLPAHLRANGGGALIVRLALHTGTVPSEAAPKGHGDEAYSLVVSPYGVTIRGAGPEGLLHGVQTLVQLIRANRRGKTLPCMVIRDWPSLRWRAFQDDLTRGPSSTQSELKREAALGAFLKFNIFTYYMEYQFAFKKHPDIGPKDGSLTPADLGALVKYAQPLGVNILGNQQSFGHFGAILSHPEFADLRETPDVLSPAREGTYKLLDDLYSEEMPELKFPYFNVCGDETSGIGDGPAKEMVAKSSVGAVYVYHMRRVHDLVAKYGKRMMMWGDIILNHKDQMAAMPKDTIMMIWGYDPRPSFDSQIEPFQQAGYKFFVCPGANDWSRVLPDTNESFPNIHNFIRDGVKHGAWGALITAWDDDGETLNAPNWYSFAWGAECAWNASTTKRADFDRRIGPVLFGPSYGDFGLAMNVIEKLSHSFGPTGLMDARFWQPDTGAVDLKQQAADADLLSSAGEAAILLRQCRNSAVANRDILDALIFGATRFHKVLQWQYLRTLGAQLYRTAAAEGGDKAATALDRIAQAVGDERTELAGMRAEYIRLWNHENRPYELANVLARYDAADKRYDAEIDALHQAAADARAGKPLPPAKDFGFDIAP